MAHDTFQIPELNTESQLRAQVDAVFESRLPEIETIPAQFQFIKDIETEIYTAREKATSTAKKPRSWLRGLVSSPQAFTVHELIERESQLGGELFGQGHKFWLDEKTSTQFHSESADWYHQQFNPQTPKTPTVLRFQTTPQSIHKIYKGREYPVTEQDVTHLIEAIKAYPSAITPLYSDTHDTV